MPPRDCVGSTLCEECPLFSMGYRCPERSRLFIYRGKNLGGKLQAWEAWMSEREAWAATTGVGEESLPDDGVESPWDPSSI